MQQRADVDLFPGHGEGDRNEGVVAAIRGVVRPSSSGVG